MDVVEQVATVASGAPDGGPARGGVRRRNRWAAIGAAAVVAASAGVLVAVAHGHGAGATDPLRPTGIPAALPTPVADLMAISPVPTAAAPGFTLTDQAGRTISLASLRGRVVVLEAMDPHCTDICPIVSQEFLQAYDQLGADRSRVVFAAVNVNQYHAAVTDMAAFTAHNGLGAVPTWHFLTGPTPALRTTWRDYGIQVQAPNPDADIIHTSILWFIDPAGTERYVATPMVDHTAAGGSYLPAADQATWARGIAIVARSLLG